MDEAISGAIKGLRYEVGEVKIEVGRVANKLDEHVTDDKQALAQVWKVIDTWNGQIIVIKWIAAVAGSAVVAHIVKHWQ